MSPYLDQPLRSLAEVEYERWVKSRNEIPPTHFPTLTQAKECAVRNQRDDMDGWTYHAALCLVPGHYIVIVRDEAGEILGAL